MQPKVSIIVPVYNDEENLRQCLDSLVNQTLDDIEIICVDDASDDSSPAILEEYLKELPSKFKILTHDTNRSASQCRKDGVLCSQGEYVMFVDGDDYVEITACSRAYEEIKRYGSDVLQFGTTVENCGNVPDARILANEKALRPYIWDLQGLDLLTACFTKNWFSVSLWNKIFKGEIARQAFNCVEDGIFEKANDLYALFFLLERCVTYNGILDELYHYCFGRGMTGRSVMSLGNFKTNCQGLKVIDALNRYISKNNLDAESPQAIAVESIARRLANEQVARWAHNLDRDLLDEGYDFLCDMWGEEKTLGNIANYFFYKNSPVALDFFADRLNQGREPKPMRTVALYYRSIFNGGAQRVVAEVSNVLARVTDSEGNARYRVILITDEPPSDSDYPIDDGIDRIVLPNYTDFPDRDCSDRIIAWREAIKAFDIDAIIYSQWISPCLPWDLIAIKTYRSDVRFIVHSHSCVGAAYRTSNDKVGQLHSTYRMADSLVVLSDVDKLYWTRVNENCHKIPNPNPAFEAKAPHERPDDDRILWIGRLSREKQPSDAIRIIERVRKERPNVTLHFVGEGDPDLRAELDNLIEAHHLQEHVFFEGFSSNVQEWHESSAILLLTSEYEGYPLTLYEAAASGLPTVTFDLPWLDYFKTIEGWESVPQHDIEGASNRIVELLSNKDKWASNSKRLSDSFSQHSSFDIAQPWVEMLEDLEKSSPRQLAQRTRKSDFDILVDEIAMFHSKGAKQSRAKFDSVRDALLLTYDEKAAINATLQRTYDEKAAINATLQRTYDEKFERGVKIRELTAENARLKKENKKRERDRKRAAEQLDKIKKSRAYVLGMALTKPYRMLKSRKNR